MRRLIIIITSILILGALGYFAWTVLNPNGVVVGPHDAFAQCLTQEGFIMYGERECAECDEQETLFGTSFQYITEVTCRDDTLILEGQRCIEKNIAYTPTWIEEGAGEVVRQRLAPGIKSLEELARVSGCEI